MPTLDDKALKAWAIHVSQHAKWMAPGLHRRQHLRRRDPGRPASHHALAVPGRPGLDGRQRLPGRVVFDEPFVSGAGHADSCGLLCEPSFGRLCVVNAAARDTVKPAAIPPR
jgi:hypothetical protein